MRSAEGYKTKQRFLIENRMMNYPDQHITVEELVSILSAEGEAVGRTTVYRTLERMVSEGKVQKYAATSGESACYQYVSDSSGCHEHFHLKCEQCGRLIHVECKHLNMLSEHIDEHHGFKVNKLKTVLYGVCEECSKK